MTINIEYETDIKLNLDYEKIINDVVNEAIDYEKCPYEAEVNVILTDNEAIHQINNEYRQVDRPTDVLSFPMINYNTPSGFDELEEDGVGAEIFDTSADSSDSVMITIEGLVSLGYSKSEAAIAVNKVEDAKDLTPEELLKKALKNIMI